MLEARSVDKPRLRITSPEALPAMSRAPDPNYQQNQSCTGQPLVLAVAITFGVGDRTCARADIPTRRCVRARYAHAVKNSAVAPPVMGIQPGGDLTRQRIT